MDHYRGVDKIWAHTLYSIVTIFSNFYALQLHLDSYQDFTFTFYFIYLLIHKFYLFLIKYQKKSSIYAETLLEKKIKLIYSPITKGVSAVFQLREIPPRVVLLFGLDDRSHFHGRFKGSFREGKPPFISQKEAIARLKVIREKALDRATEPKVTRLLYCVVSAWQISGENGADDGEIWLPSREKDRFLPLRSAGKVQDGGHLLRPDCPVRRQAGKRI